MAFLDFHAIKENVSFAETIDLLTLSLQRSGNQWRGPCPACATGGDRALVVTEGRGYYCFADKKGGDQIALVAHVLELSAKDAAHELAKRAGLLPVQGTSTVPSTSSRERKPPESGRGKETEKFQPLTYLEHDHDAVIAVGFDPEKAKAMGIGYAPRGVARGFVLIPVRDENGVLHGYVGVTEAWLPSDFKTNVVALRRA